MITERSKRSYRLWPRCRLVAS